MPYSTNKEELRSLIGAGLPKSYVRKKNLLRFLSKNVPQGIIFDPMAGTGSIGELKKFDWNGFAWANDMIDWNGYRCDTVDKWTFFDAQNLEIESCIFDAIVFNPPIGLSEELDNDLFFKGIDRKSKEVIYHMTEATMYGERLPKNNLCDMINKGPFYDILFNAFNECYRVLKKGSPIFVDRLESKRSPRFFELYSKMLSKIGFEIDDKYYIKMKEEDELHSENVVFNTILKAVKY